MTKKKDYRNLLWSPNKINQYWTDFSLTRPNNQRWLSSSLLGPCKREKRTVKVEIAAGILWMRTTVLWLRQPAASTSRFILSRNMRQRSNSVGDVEFDAEPQFFGQEPVSGTKCIPAHTPPISQRQQIGGSGNPETGTISLSSFLDPAHR